MPLRHIAVPVELSDRADDAARLALRIAARHGARLTLFQARRTPVWATALGGEIVYPPFAVQRMINERVELGSERLLDELARALREQMHVRTDIATETAQGEPAEALLEFVAEHDVDLVVAPSHGQGLISRIFHTSEAGVLARRASAPVLVLSPETDSQALADRGIQSMVIAVDYTAAARLATELAADLIEPGGSLYFVHVWEEIDDTERHEISGAPSDNSPTRELGRSLEAARLRRFVAELGATGFRTEVFLETGDPAAEIVHRAEELGADAVAIGSHRHRGLGDRLVGTVLDRVLDDLEAPVLAIPETAVAAHARAHQEEMLDETIDESFPASDPPSWGTDPDWATD